MAHPKRTVYDLLAKQAISEITAEHLDASVASTRVDKETIEFWTGPITIHRVIEMRTYPHGLSIPEQSVISGAAVAAGEELDIQPPGTELWNVIAIGVTAISGTPAVSVNAYDGATDALMHSGSASTTASSFFPWESPIPITNSCYLRITNGDLSNAIIVTVAYHKVGL